MEERRMGILEWVERKGMEGMDVVKREGGKGMG